MFPTYALRRLRKYWPIEYFTLFSLHAWRMKPLLLNNIYPLDNTEKTLANAVQNPTHYTRLLYFAFLARLVNAAAGLRESTEPISRCGALAFVVVLFVTSFTCRSGDIITKAGEAFFLPGEPAS